jgi:transcriptional regulator with XRE-family HTH domain
MYDIMNILENIGAVIRFRRKHLGMTQQDVAEIAGVQRQTISRVETGNGTVAVTTLALVAKVVGLDLGVNPRYEQGRS